MELCNYEHPNKIRYFEIEAIKIPIVYNKYEDYDPDGLLYVLKKDAARIKEGALHNFNQKTPQPYEEVVPLVIRANVGDTVVISFSHSLNRPLSIHVQGLSYDVQTSDGANVGFNMDSTTKNKRTYTWYATQGGVYLFHDMADSTGNENGTNIHEGMWTLWRIHDRLENGTGSLPDGTPIPPLRPLTDRKAPPKKDAAHPGYPNFINGTFGDVPRHNYKCKGI